MREILFRGKRADNGEWVEGDFCKPHHIIYSEFAYDDTLKRKEVIYCEADVIPETVGQYTSLTDRNGKKIFEGDIIKIGLSEYVVRFDRQRLKYCIRKHGFQSDLWALGKDAEVIGNIYDNPELLEVKTDA